MADKTLYTRIKNLVKSASDWTTSNPTLLQGEVGFESDTGKSKLGDGVTAWNSLGYIKVTTVDNLTSTSTTEPLSANQGKLLKGLIDDRTPIATSVTIATADWSNYSCTKTVTGMTSDKAVIVTPDPTSMDNYVDASIKCTAQGTNSLTFTCSTVPSASITINILMIEVLPPPPKSVGGIIYYIDSTADGEYTFYDANGDQVSAPTVGIDCTGWTYEVTGATKDKYYVVYNELYTHKRWTYYSNGAYVYTSLGTGTAIGTGKTNTATVMSADNGAYVTSDSNGYPTVWYQIQQMRTNKVGGCDDWFVGSEYELYALHTSGAGNSATWFSGNYIWASSESDDNHARNWKPNMGICINSTKYGDECMCGIRSF